jgi:hypothetical protein
MTEGGLPRSGIPIRESAICVGCEMFFFASDGKCPSCGTTIGWMVTPARFVTEGGDRGDETLVMKPAPEEEG